MTKEQIISQLKKGVSFQKFPEFSDNEEIVQEALLIDYKSALYMSKRLKNDDKFALSFVQLLKTKPGSSISLKLWGKKVRENKEITFNLLDINLMYIVDTIHHFKNDKDIISKMISIGPFLVKFAGSKILLDKDIYLPALHHYRLDFFNTILEEIFPTKTIIHLLKASYEEGVLDELFENSERNGKTSIFYNRLLLNPTIKNIILNKLKLDISSVILNKKNILNDIVFHLKQNEITSQVKFTLLKNDKPIKF